jgi:hypothetical protein
MVLPFIGDARGAAVDGPLDGPGELHFWAVGVPSDFAKTERSIVPCSATTFASDWTRANQPSVYFGPMR